jgi:3-methyladenine DNA glycosylase AlkD
MKVHDVLEELKSLGNEHDRKGMGRFGINVENAYGISIHKLRGMAKPMGTDHALALKLWKSGKHEARLLACLIDDPEKVTETQMERWARDFDSWDMVDICCGNLFDRTPFAYRKAFEWSGRDEEFVKRAGFVLMAALSVHDKQAKDSSFMRFLPIIRREAHDERNFIKKAVNWALRQIGKRNTALNKAAIKAALDIQKQGTKPARWIASDALRELKSPKVQARLRR